jgi:hypothetical protein
MTSLGGMVQWRLGVGRVTMDTCRVEALSGTMVASMVDLTGAMQIFARKMDQKLIAVTASVPWT